MNKTALNIIRNIKRRLLLKGATLLQKFVGFLPFSFYRQGSVGSVGSESTFVGGEGGPPGVQINEFQAAWNVTNAIQVSFWGVLKDF